MNESQRHQHVTAGAGDEIEHDLGYKSQAQIPRTVRRKFSRLAGLLEIADEEFVEAGAAFLDAAIDDPAYVRTESSLMAAFSGMPRVELPENNLQRRSRLFELRVYESHSLRAHKRKIAMFNEGGEIDIFRRTGLNPVFFGETLVGTRFPNLTYMLGFDNMEAKEKGWKAFISHPDWKDCKSRPEYADTVSNITNIMLRPVAGSQI